MENPLTQNENFLGLNKYRLKCFTLLEIVIALALTSILIMFVLLYFHYINNIYHYTTKVHDSVYSEMFFRNQIIDDFNNSNSITSPANNIITINFNDNILNYQFLDSIIIRSGTNADTFKLQNSLIELQFIDYEEVFVRSLNMKIINKDLIHNVYVAKDYDNSFKYHIIK